VSEADVALVAKLCEHWSAGEYLTPDLLDREVVFVRTGGDAGLAGLEGEWRGWSEVWAAGVEFLRAWDDLRTVTDEIVDLDGRVLVLGRQTGRGKGSGALVEQEVGFIVTVCDEKAVRIEGYLGHAAARQAAGL
jgi:ketosteroid isomerase-like protein